MPTSRAHCNSSTWLFAHCISHLMQVLRRKQEKQNLLVIGQSALETAETSPARYRESNWRGAEFSYHVLHLVGAVVNSIYLWLNWQAHDGNHNPEAKGALHSQCCFTRKTYSNTDTFQSKLPTICQWHGQTPDLQSTETSNSSSAANTLNTRPVFCISTSNFFAFHNKTCYSVSISFHFYTS